MQTVTCLVPNYLNPWWTTAIQPHKYYTYYQGQWLIDTNTSEAYNLARIKCITPMMFKDPRTFPYGVPSYQSPHVREFVSSSGESPVGQTYKVSGKVGGKNSPFIKRRNEGEILHHDYEKWELVYTREPVITSSNLLVENVKQIMTDEQSFLPFVEGAYIDPAGKKLPAWTDPYQRGIASQFVISYDKMEITYDDVYKHEFDYERHAQFTRSLVASQMPSDRIITSLMAKANNGYFDLLTFYAELPKTIEYLWQCLERLKNTILFFKQKEIRSGWQREKPPLIPYGASGWPEHKRIPENKRRKKAHKESVDPLALPDAIARIRLEFVYSIKPIINDIKGISKALEKIGRVYQTVRTDPEKLEVDYNWGWWNFKGTVECDDVTFLKRRLMVDSFVSALLDVTKVSVLTTAVELIPIWGIVINYFTNIGDALSAWSIPQPVEQQIASYSIRFQVDGTYSHTQNEDDKVRVRGYVYNIRKLDNPLACTAFLPADSLNVNQILNLFSLAWVTMRSKVKGMPVHTAPISYTE